MLLQFEVAVVDLLLIGPIEFHRLAEHEQEFFAPVPFQALDHLLWRGLHPGGDQRGQFPGITLSFQDGLDDVHATDTTGPGKTKPGKIYAKP
jgi:hypothetical protein